MSEAGGSIVRVLLAILAPIAALAGGTEETTPSTEIACDIVEAEWSVRVWGREIGGSLCCLSAGGSRLRIDLVEGGGTAACLAREGDGWTVAQAGGGTMTVNRWGEEWDVLDEDLARAVRILAGVCAGGRSGARAAVLENGAAVVDGTRRRPAVRGRENGPEATTEFAVVFGGEEEGGSLRTELVSRGRGRGSTRETLVFRWSSDTEATVVSSRRPGTLAWREIRRRPVVVPLPEAFLPLWPLRSLIPHLDASGRGPDGTSEKS